MRLALASVLLFVTACGGTTEPDRCVDGPTFSNNVYPLIDLQCLGCHSTTKIGASRKGAPEDYNYDTYESAQPAFDAMVSAITSGRMPPPEETQIATTAEERAMVGKWQSCGFPKSPGLAPAE